MPEEPPPNPNTQDPISVKFNQGSGSSTYQVTCSLSTELTAKFGFALESFVMGFNSALATLPPKDLSRLYSQVVQQSLANRFPTPSVPPSHLPKNQTQVPPSQLPKNQPSTWKPQGPNPPFVTGESQQKSPSRSTLHVSNIPADMPVEAFRKLLRDWGIFYLRVTKCLNKSYGFVRVRKPSDLEFVQQQIEGIACPQNGETNAPISYLKAAPAKYELILLPGKSKNSIPTPPHPTPAAPSISTSNPDNSSALVDSGAATPAVPTNLPSSPANHLPSASQLSSANVLTQQDTPHLCSDEPLSPSTSSSTPPTTQLSSSPTSITPPQNSNTPPRLTSKHPRDTPGDSPELRNSPKRHLSLDHETSPTMLPLTELEND